MRFFFFVFVFLNKTLNCEHRLKFLACQKIKLLLRCPLEFPALVINSGFNNRIPLFV